MEANRSRIFENSIFIFSSVLLSGALIFLTIILIARYLGAVDFGQFSVVLAIVGLIQLFADGGFISITVRNISTHRERLAEIIGNSLTTMLIMSIFFFVFSFFILFFIDKSFEFKLSLMVMLVGSFVMLQGLVYGAAIRAMEDMGITAIASVIHKIVLLILVWLAIILDYSFLGVAVAHLFSNLGYTIALSIIVNKKYARTAYLINLQEWKSIIKDSIPLGLAMLLRKLTIHLDTVLLIILSTALAVGLYSSAYRVLQMVEIAAIALSGVLFPVMARLAKKNDGSLGELFNQSFFILMAFALPLSLWFSLASENLILIFYGQEYVDAKSTLAVLGLALFLPVITSLNHPLFTAINKQRFLIYIALVGLTVNVVIDIVLIPKYSYLGAAIGTACTELVIFIFSLTLLYKNKIFLKRRKRLLSVVLSSLLSCYAYTLLPDDNGFLYEVFRLTIMFSIYMVGLYLLKVFMINDLLLLLNKIKQINQ